MSMSAPERTVAELLTDLSRQLSALFRQEARLARVEVTGHLQAMARDAVVIGIGAALGLAALMAATAALILLLVQLDVVPWIAAAIVAGVLAMVAGVLVQARLTALRRRAATPVASVESIKETTQWIKNETVGRSTSR